MPPPNELNSADAAVDATILLPCYNEERAIETVVSAIRAAMEKSSFKYELVVVDDASTDRTPELAAALGVRVVRHAVNRGSGAARRTGTIAARGERIAMLDADGTYDAGDLPRMLELLSDFDQVNGARDREAGTMAPLRFLAKWSIRRIAIHLSGRHIPDLNTGLKAYKRSVMLRYLWVLPEGFSCVTTMTLAFLCNGHPVKYIPTKYSPRIGKSKFHPVHDSLQYLMTVLRMVTYFAPLRVFLPLGGFFVLAGIVKSVVDIKVTPGIQESDIILISVGALIVSVGMLADLIVAQKRQ